MNKKFWKIGHLPSRLLTTGIAMTLSTVMMAQSKAVTGTVVDESGEPVIGATVKVKGTGQGAVTDINGKFTLNADPGQTLQFSYVGMSPVQTVIKAGAPIRVTLKEDAVLNDVVVVGYGVQKKSVVTAAIAKVGKEDLDNTAPLRVDNALKGLAAGVQVTSSSGQPGAAARVRIRGIGTINNSDPLYIVDGIAIEGGIDYLNPNDIESIEVLKDAASGAIYGARAANGVVLVTTKTGSNIGKTSVKYDFSYGISNPWHKREVLNASEYAVLMNEGRLNANITPTYSDPYSYGQGTDWQDEVFNKNAANVMHSVTIDGASEKLKYHMSALYNDVEGIVGGNYGRSNYQRLALRSNNIYTLFDKSQDREYLKKMTLTANVAYSRIKARGIEVNSTWGSALSSALALSPILSVYDSDPKGQIEKYSKTESYTPVYGANGQLFTVPGTDYAEMNNPIADFSLPATENWSHKLVANFAAEIELYTGLKFKTSYNADMSFYGWDKASKKYYLSGNNWSKYDGFASESDRNTVWSISNVMSYEKEFGKHSISVVLGQEAHEAYNKGLGGSANNLIDPNKPSISYSYGQKNPVDVNTEILVDPVSGSEYEVYKGYKLYTNTYGWFGAKHRIASLFGRASYNYDERYMGEFTIRRDGSSNFGPNNKWATFPSFSVGWNILNEPFMQDKKPEWMQFAKLRYSWGKNGNESIGSFGYVALTSTGNNYQFGTSEKINIGTKADKLPNPDLRWEESVQHDLGLDLGFFNNALTVTVDYFNKRTNGMLMKMVLPSYVGESAPDGNVGTMENSGVELETTFKQRIGDVNFKVGGNISYLKNKLIKLGNDTGWQNYDSFQGTGAISRAENGEPFPFFYGYKTNGLFQNVDEINSYVNSNGDLIQPSAKPGDVRFVDVNGDGVISDDDRTKIGKGTPDWSWGLNLSANWNGFDFYMLWQGTIGNDIYDCTRRTDINQSNLPKYMLNRWTGEGTSNRIPRFEYGDNANWQSSDLYVYDGSYARLKNIQLGYTLPASITNKAFIEKLRIFVSAENLLTFTKYHGYDPEISSGGTSLGIDYGCYPQPRTVSFGASVSF